MGILGCFPDGFGDILEGYLDFGEVSDGLVLAVFAGFLDESEVSDGGSQTVVDEVRVRGLPFFLGMGFPAFSEEA